MRIISISALLFGLLVISGCKSGNPWHPYPYINAQPNSEPSQKIDSENESIFEKYGISPKSKTEQDYKYYDDSTEESSVESAYPDNETAVIADNDSIVRDKSLENEKKSPEKPAQSKESILKNLNELDKVLGETSEPDNTSSTKTPAKTKAVDKKTP